MEDLSKLLLEERAHSEQFKTNFIQLKIEFDKLVSENHRLNNEILKLKECKPEEPNEVLKRKLKNTEKELQGKDHLVVSLQDKLQAINDVLKEKIRREGHYTSKILSTENALEQTKMLLSNLQLETSVLVKNIEKTRKTDEQSHQQDLITLSERCAKSDHEKRHIARQIIKATAKAKNTTEFLKQENGLLNFTITKLKETIDKLCWEKSELSSQLETIKVQYGQDRGEMIMQIRNLECESTKLEAKCEALERNVQEAFREKEKAVLAFQIAENNEIKLRSNVYELEIKNEKAVDQFKRDLEQRDTKHNVEIVELNKTIHALKFELDQERSRIQHQSNKLRIHEKEVMAIKEDLRKKEIEVASQVQNVKIETEDKYRALIEDKFQSEMEASRKCAEIESQLILERNVKSSLEAEVRKLASDNQIMNERVKSLDEYAADKKQLQNTLEILEKERQKLSDEFDRHKESSLERYKTLIKEREVMQSQLADANQNTSKVVTELREHISQLQSRLAASEQEAESQLKRVQTALKANQQKSQQYAKLIWKLRERLAKSQTQLPVTPSSLF